MDHSQKEKFLEELSCFEHEKHASFENISSLPKNDKLKYHFHNLKNLCNKQKLMSIWVKKMLPTTWQKQSFMIELSEITTKLKRFEKTLHKDYYEVLKNLSDKEIDTIHELDEGVKNLKEFMSHEIEDYFKQEEKLSLSSTNKEKQETKNFLKSDHILMNLIFDIINNSELIENEINELFSRKYYLKILIQNFSPEILENLKSSYDELINQEMVVALLKYYKFIKQGIESLDVIETFLFESCNQSKISTESPEIIARTDNKYKSLSLNLKKSDSSFNVHGNAFILSSNGESASLKEKESKKNEIMPISYSRTTSINSLKYYDEIRSEMTFQFDSTINDDNAEKKSEITEKKIVSEKKTHTFNCNFLKCGFF